jgi:starch synthase (maltosyl-transferring)
VIGRIVISDVSPVVSAGQWPAKAVVDELIPVSATIFREGHDLVGANVVVIDPAGREGPLTRMTYVGAGTDRYEATVRATSQGVWSYRIEGWADPIATWLHAAQVKAEAGQDVDELAVDLEDGARLLERALPGIDPVHQAAVTHAIQTLRNDALTDVADRLAPVMATSLVAALEEHPLRELLTTSPAYEITVDRQRALFSAWYEFFPRSEGATLDPPRSGTLKQAAKRLPAIADLGFDVVYLPPISPIGEVNRKGPNNTLNPAPSDPGSPWAIGSRFGGHDAVHPDLGTIEDFDAFVAQARKVGLEVALDLALQCAPDHPWAKEHPEWFTVKSDGSIAYAENPPKKYQDIYPINFDGDYKGLYAEVIRVVRHWMSHGVRIFRVDNPHTKPVPFWEELIADIKRTDPDVLFLAEAFTRPPMMHTLGRIGFTQSYTYFTWRNEKAELEEYGAELVEAAWHMRPNFFVNTPDILHAYLQYGGPPAFKIRAVLAALLSPSWGVYSGYELYEHVARPGAEEYLDNEKFQYRPRDWAAYEEGGAKAGQSLAPYLRRLNEIRRQHPALHRLRNLTFHTSDDPEIIVYSKRRTVDGRDDTIVVVVNLDPHSTRETWVHLDMEELGLTWDEGFLAHDLITGQSWHWGEHAFVRLGRDTEPAHVLHVRSL